MKNVVVTLYRDPEQSKETVGTWVARLADEIIFKCDSIERPWLNNQHGVSCFVIGEYDVVWSFMHSANKFHYEIKNIPDRDACFVHGGNRYLDSHGCTILGDGYEDIDGDGLKDVINSAKTVDKFEELMNHEPFKLIVVNKKYSDIAA